MLNTKIEKLIIKYISRSITDNECDTLFEWLNIPENRSIFKDYLLVNYAVNYNLNNVSANQFKNKLMGHIRKEKSVFYKNRQKSFFKYAALVVVFFCLGYVFNASFFKNETELQQLIINSEDVTLHLENGDTEILNVNNSSKITDKRGNILGVQNKSKLIYNNSINENLKDEISPKVLVYNTLKVPYGKKFEIQLSDGTNVFLNSGTSFRYPIEFIEGKDRLVFVKGEAFFDVAKDASHPFIVNANDLNIRVLGTKFNVSSYTEDADINTVLVEGAVSLYNQDNKYNSNTAVNLKPGYLAAWDKSSKEILIDKADLELHSAWIYGKIVFRHLGFNKIIKKLERHYNVEIVNKNEALGNKFFTANFDVETIDQVLKSFNANYSINYTIESNKIIIY